MHRPVHFPGRHILTLGLLGLSLAFSACHTQLRPSASLYSPYAGSIPERHEQFRAARQRWTAHQAMNYTYRIEATAPNGARCSFSNEVKGGQFSRQLDVQGSVALLGTGNSQKTIDGIFDRIEYDGHFWADYSTEDGHPTWFLLGDPDNGTGIQVRIVSLNFHITQ